MSNINFFQRYSQKENVVTNNTLRLLAQLYDHRPSLLNELISKIVDGVSIETGISMEQQTREEDSVPDGALTQESLKLVIETKPSDNYDLNQLKNHIKAFDDEHHKILLLLLKNIDDSSKESIEEKLPDNQEIDFGVVTYQDLIQYLIGSDGLIEDYARDLETLVEDYRNFCSDEELLPVDDLMRAVPCGHSHQETEKYDIYYAPAQRGYQRHQYIGVYYNKCIQAIGKIECVVEADKEETGLNIKNVKWGDYDPDNREEDILNIIEASKDRGNDNIVSGKEFFLVDKFHKTDFEKTSKGGIMFKYFNLRNHLDIEEGEDLPDTEQIADDLGNREWS